METVSKFGERLLKLREERNETQQQLADTIGITRQSLSRYETNDRTPNIDLVYNIAKHYNVSSDYLLGLSETKSIGLKLQATCEYTGLNEFTAMSLHSLKDDPFSPVNLINFVYQNGGFGDLSILLEKLKHKIDTLLYEKKKLMDEFKKIDNITTIDDKFIYSQAIQGLSPIKEICQKIISIKDNIEFNRFSIQRAILRRIDIYEEQEVQKFNAEHNSTKE